MTKEEMVAAKIPEDLHDNALLKEVKDLPTLAKVAVDLKSYQGQSIRIPGPESGDADKKEFHEKLKKAAPSLVEIPDDEKAAEPITDILLARLGKPKDRTGYPTLKDLGIETKMDEESLRAQADELGLTKKQYERMAKATAKIMEAQAQKNSELAKAIKSELGEAFEERLTAAAAVAKKLGRSAEFVEKLKNGAVNAEEAKSWINVAKAMGAEAGELGGQDGGGSQKITPSEARERIDELYRNPALHDKSHPRHPELVAKLLDYTRAANPGE
jgi:hypothetical protein